MSVDRVSSLKLELLCKVWNPCRGFSSQVIGNAHNFLGTNCILEFKRKKFSSLIFSRVSAAKKNQSEKEPSTHWKIYFGSEHTGGSLNSRVLQFADPPIRGLFFVTQIPQFAAKNLQFAVFSAILRKFWQARDQNLKSLKYFIGQISLKMVFHSHDSTKWQRNYHQSKNWIRIWPKFP